MQNSTKTALLVGATGVVGRRVLQQLLQNPAYHQVLVWTRQPTGVSAPHLTEVQVDFRQLPPMPAVDDVFCALGTTIRQAGSQAAFKCVDYAYPLAVAQLAKQAGAKQFLIVTAMGAHARSFVFYNRVKGQVEQALRQMGFDSLWIMRPSLLMAPAHERRDTRPAESLSIRAMRLFHPLLVGPLKDYQGIAPDLVAQAMVQKAQLGTLGVHVVRSGQMNSRS